MRARFAALALAVSLAGCTDVIGVGSQTDGRYRLETFNGYRPPVVTYESAYEREELIDSDLRLYANGEYDLTFTYRVSDASGSHTESDPGSGTYTRSGDELRFRDDRTGSVTYAYYDGQRLEVDANGDVYVYRRY